MPISSRTTRQQEYERKLLSDNNRENKKYFFKSNQGLIEVSKCSQFVVRRGWFWNRNKHYLYGRECYKKGYYDKHDGAFVTPRYYDVFLGEYPTEERASLALEEVMELLEITKLEE